MRSRPPLSPVRRGRRGQPLVVLGLVLGSWGLLRLATGAMPAGLEEAQAAPVAPYSMHAAKVQDSPPMAAPAARDEGDQLPRGFGDPSGWESAPPPVTPQSPALPHTGWSAPPTAGTAGQVAAFQPVPARLAAGHTLLMAAGFSQMELPPEVAAFFTRASLPGPQAGPATERVPAVAAAGPASVPNRASSPASRWSGDGWLLWRDDTTTPVTSGRPSYGRSQLGAVVRYELVPGSGHRPQAYLRGSAALQGAREREVAVGLSARPLARMPLRVAAELRAGDRASGFAIRPAAYAVTEIAPQQMPGGLVAEAYAQAGYVGGRGATAFVDGQARIDRSLAASADFDLRAGAAAWGGAQDDGARLDVGPSASLVFRLGEARGRLAADYRFRVTGNAEPASGPALTLSAGF
jgi:hypothetical protein